MLILLSVISVILLGLFIWLTVWALQSYDHDELATIGVIGIAVFVVLLVVCVGCMIDNIATLSTSYTIDEKLQMYEEENVIIESTLASTVENYLEHEENILKELTPEEAMTMIASYPTLSSDSIVVEQMATYKANRARITELKEEKINLSKVRWWVYFG